jgi:hypothetical protein
LISDNDLLQRVGAVTLETATLETADKVSGADHQRPGPEEAAPADKDCSGTFGGQAVRR